MENHNNNRDFEEFVKQNADQYRMFPSEKVWNGIHNTLHTRRRWYGLGLGLLLLTTGAAVTLVMLNPSVKTEKPPVTSTVIAENSLVAIDKKPTTTPAAMIESGFRLKTDVPVVVAPAQSTPFDDQLRNSAVTSLIVPFESNEIPVIAVQNQTKPTIDFVAPLIKGDNEIVASTPLHIRITDQATDNNFPLEDLSGSGPDIAAGNALLRSVDMNPLTIESVINSYRHASKRKRLSWQVYMVPTISYRKLTENTAFLKSAQSNNSPYSYAALHDINSAVTHKPDMGLEFGFNTGYPLSRTITLIAGLQFNVSKYDIRAYSAPSEVATIALSNGPGASSVSMVSNYRNFGGYSSNWLHNLYISISAPIGAELKLTGRGKTYLGISGTVQPTYILSDRAYLISTDYKNYATVPSLIRRWNVSTSFETFAGYSTGKLKWKVGPQVRYQMLSSFQEKYPVREHLFDFGLKIGLMLNN